MRNTKTNTHAVAICMGHGHLQAAPLDNRGALDAAVVADRARIADAMRRLVRLMRLPDTPQYPGDERHTEKRMLLALADATAEDSWPNVRTKLATTAGKDDDGSH